MKCFSSLKLNLKVKTNDKYKVYLENAVNWSSYFVDLHLSKLKLEFKA